MAKVMLVEDDNNLREIYEARLLAEGYEIVSARDGEEALALAVKERPDLIIADVMMPKISGFDMLDILRSTPETKNTKVIIMTALSQAEDKSRADQLGADRYLVKSQVTLEDVAKAAREVLQDQPDLPPAAEPAFKEPLAPLPTGVAEPADTTPSFIEPTTMPSDTDFVPSLTLDPVPLAPGTTTPSNDAVSNTINHSMVIEPTENATIGGMNKLDGLTTKQDRLDEIAQAIEPIISQPIVPAEPVSVPAMAPEPDTSAPVLPMAPEPSTTMPMAPEPVAATMPAMTMPEVTPVPAPTEPTATFDPITPPTTPDATTPPAPSKTDLLTDPNLIAL
jgi:CheY-like chemotaxis protein